MPTQNQKLIHNTIPTSFFVSDMYLFFVKGTAGAIDGFVTRSMFNKKTNKDVGMGL